MGTKEELLVKMVECTFDMIWFAFKPCNLNSTEFKVPVGNLAGEVKYMSLKYKNII